MKYALPCVPHSVHVPLELLTLESMAPTNTASVPQYNIAFIFFHET